MMTANKSKLRACWITSQGGAADRRGAGHVGTRRPQLSSESTSARRLVFDAIQSTIEREQKELDEWKSFTDANLFGLTTSKSASSRSCCVAS